MKEQCTPKADAKAGEQAAPERIYRFSPKVVIIAGPPAAGKSYAARKLADELGYELLRLDSFTHKVAEQYGGDIEVVRQPGTYTDFKNVFLPQLRARRYRNIVFEGCRISHPHIHQAFLDALDDIYSPFTIVRAFYLNPDRDVRLQRFTLRRVIQTKEAVKAGRELPANTPFCEMLEPVLDGYEVIEDSDDIVRWAEENKDTVHPGVPESDREVFKAIAEADSFNPFYQTIEYRGRLLVPGFTQSGLAWRNILKLGVEFKGKTLCDYGCMHGYYTFKAEEMGAAGVGLDMDQGAVDLANYLAGAKGVGLPFHGLRHHHPTEAEVRHHPGPERPAPHGQVRADHRDHVRPLQRVHSRGGRGSASGDHHRGPRARGSSSYATSRPTARSRASAPGASCTWPARRPSR